MAFEQGGRGQDVVALVGGDEEADRPSKTVAGHMDLGRQSSSGTPHSRGDALFLAAAPAGRRLLVGPHQGRVLHQVLIVRVLD